MIFEKIRSAIENLEASMSRTTRSEPSFVVAEIMVMLEMAFPALSKLLGPECLLLLVRGFFRVQPGHGNRHVIGSAFPSYIGGLRLPRYAAYLGDVARLDLLVLQTMSTETGTTKPLRMSECPSEPQSLDHVVWFHPTVELFMSCSGAVSIWQHCVSRSGLSAYRASLRDDAALLIRISKEVDVISLDLPGCDVFLALLMKGHTIREAADGAEFVDKDFDCRRAIEFLTSTGAIVSVEPGPSRCAPPKIATLRHRARLCIHSTPPIDN
jgi:hypothetical protein